jgi:hypothetical protein
MQKLWIHAALAAAVCIWSNPASAQHPVVPPQGDAEQQLTDLTVRAANALVSARVAAEACNAKGLADAVSELRQLERQSRQAASGARSAGEMSAIRPAFADGLHDRIASELQDALALKPRCPVPSQQPAQTAPPQTNPPPPPPPPVEQPTGGFLPGKTQPPRDLIGELESQADDAVDAYWAAYRRCDKDGMKRALDKLRQIAEQVHEIHETATAAGKYGRFSRDDIEDMVDLEDDIDDFIDDSVFDVPKCPVPSQSIGRAGSTCPAPTALPRESLLSQPYKLDFGYTPRLTSTRYSSEILDYHNALRLQFGSPKLSWNPALSAGAAAWAKTMSDTGQLTHSPRTGREGERENLSLSLHGANTLQRMLDGWGTERASYRPGVFPNVSVNGDWMSVAHYTQMVWPTTTEVGCGFYSGRKYDALVCRYAPPGNTDGKPLVPPNPCFPPPPPPPPPPPAPGDN